EDGIRDDLVTGVQTCALPIFMVSWLVVLASRPARILISSTAASGFSRITLTNMSLEILRVSSFEVALAVAVRGTSPKIAISPRRSEERRVGKGVRLGWAAVGE